MITFNLLLYNNNICMYVCIFVNILLLLLLLSDLGNARVIIEAVGCLSRQLRLIYIITFSDIPRDRGVAD